MVDWDGMDMWWKWWRVGEVMYEDQSCQFSMPIGRSRKTWLDNVDADMT